MNILREGTKSAVKSLTPFTTLLYKICTHHPVNEHPAGKNVEHHLEGIISMYSFIHSTVVQTF